MPFSDDEYDSMQDSQVSTISKAELRKMHKPLMEKRRRTRINNYLNEIKNLILEGMNKDPSRHSKLEKADILEMAVKHIQNVQKGQLAIAIASNPAVMQKFKTGFNECAVEIQRFMEKSDSVNPSVRDRVSNHLHKYINNMEQRNPFPAQTSGNISIVQTGNIFSTVAHPDSQVGDQNNNPRLQIPQGIQLIPSRLPTGELALLVPNSSNLSYFSSPSLPQRSSAFVTVNPQNSKVASPLNSPTEDSRASPKGFRPVNSNIIQPRALYHSEDRHVPQISPAEDEKTNKPQMEVKPMRFPIHKPTQDKEKKFEHFSVIRKVSEPLSIITNQGERHRQAQQKEDSCLLEENQVHSRGIKRGFSEIHQGILTTVSQDLRPAKLFKSYHDVSHHPSSSFTNSDHNPVPVIRSRLEVANEREEYEPEPANDGVVENNERSGDSNDMWRPW